MTAAAAGADAPPESLTFALALAIQRNDVVDVTSLLAKGADADATWEPPESHVWEPHRMPLLVLAAREADANVVRALLAAGASLHSEWEYDEHKFPDGYQGTHSMGDALAVAAWHGKVDVVEALLHAGASAASRAHALARAAGSAQHAVARLLLDHGVDPGTHTSKPLLAAVQSDNLAMVELLVEYGALLDARFDADGDDYGSRWSPFECALLLGRRAVVALLHAQGARLPTPERVHELVRHASEYRTNAEAMFVALGLPPPRAPAERKPRATKRKQKQQKKKTQARKRKRARRA